MPTRNDVSTIGRALRSAGAAAGFMLAQCTDLGVSPDPSPLGVAHDVSAAATWTETLLPLPKGAETSNASDVNDNGVVVGSVTIAGMSGSHAVRWKNGHPKYLDEPPDPTLSTIPNAVNNSGMAVGFRTPGVGEPEAVFWKRNGKVTILAGLPGGFADVAYGVNDAGVIVGQSQNRAARWVDGVVEDLHPPGYAKSRATDINAAGDIVGWVEYITGEHRAYIWHADGSQEELGVLVGDVHSEATGVNDGANVVGSSGDLVSTSLAFLWTDAAGIVDALLGISETHGTDISGSGRIVGYREFVVNNQLRAVALTRHNNVLDTLPNSQGVTARAHAVNLCGTVAGTVETSAGNRAVVWKQQTCDP